MRIKFSAIIRAKVWNKHYNIKYEKCRICNVNNISPFLFEVGHKKSLYNGGGNEINNLIPICSMCNRSIGKKNIKIK